MVETVDERGGLDAPAELVRAQQEIVNLRDALLTARRIGAAIGVIMANRRISYDQAFASLRIVSQRDHRKIRDLAEDVLLTGMLDDAFIDQIFRRKRPPSRPIAAPE